MLFAKKSLGRAVGVGAGDVAARDISLRSRAAISTELKLL